MINPTRKIFPFPHPGKIGVTCKPFINMETQVRMNTADTVSARMKTERNKHLTKKYESKNLFGLRILKLLCCVRRRWQAASTAEQSFGYILYNLGLGKATATSGMKLRMTREGKDFHIYSITILKLPFWRNKLTRASDLGWWMELPKPKYEHWQHLFCSGQETRHCHRLEIPSCRAHTGGVRLHARHCWTEDTERCKRELLPQRVHGPEIKWIPLSPPALRTSHDQEVQWPAVHEMSHARWLVITCWRLDSWRRNIRNMDLI